MCIALVGLCASAQQKGDMAVGLNLGVAPCLEKNASLTNFGIGAKFQYNVTKPIRLEADVDYWFKDKGMDVFDVSANVHYIFNFGEKLSVYPLVGIGYGRVGFGGFSFDEDDFDYYSRGWLDDLDDDYEDYEGGTSANKFLFNVGVGAEYALSSRFSVGLEIKYQYMKDFSRLPISIGATYRF